MSANLPVSLRGHELLADPLLNKDGAFSEEEREAFSLRGLLPTTVVGIEQQVQLELEHLRRKRDPLEQHIGLIALQDRSETLFHRLLVENLEECADRLYAHRGPRLRPVQPRAAAAAGPLDHPRRRRPDPGAAAQLGQAGRPPDRGHFLGAGAAGIGIARLVHTAMVEAGAQSEAARRSILMLDSQGLVYRGRERTDLDKLEFAADTSTMAALGLSPDGDYDLETLVERFAPTVLIGTSGTPGTFTEKAVRAMAAATPRPLILPMSNPTANSEATPEEVLRWTGGRALVATGSPFPPVEVDGRQIAVGQANNVYVFPGIGLGAIVSEARQVTDRMFLTAARVLAGRVSPERLAEGALYPPLGSLRDVSRAIAVAVAAEAAASGVGLPLSAPQIESAVDRWMWWPEYQRYRPAGLTARM